MHHEGICGTKKPGRQASAIRKKEEGIEGWSSRQLPPFGRRVSAYEDRKKTLELEFVKRARGMSSSFGKIRKLTLWRGRPPPKWKRTLQIQEEPVKWEHRALNEL
jgi:hypothetical protein